MPVPAWFTEVLERELQPWLSLSAEQVSRLYVHYQFLERWNKKMNLTSVEAGVDLVVRHYCESLFLGAHIPAHGATEILDIGSGAGFPGVPIAVLHPAWQVTLVESAQRKAVFLRESTRHLDNITVSAHRVEDIDGAYDLIVSRAVEPTEILRHVPRLASRLALLIGEQSYSELKTKPGIAWANPVRLPWGDQRLCIVGRFHVEQ